MAIQAIGLLETRGLACLVTGVDAMLKSANVELTGPVRMVGSGLCNAVITGDVAASVDDPLLRETVAQAIEAANASVSRAESIREFVILPRDLTIDDDELTPTLKVRRAIVLSRYEAAIGSIYGT